MFQLRYSLYLSFFIILIPVAYLSPTSQCPTVYMFVINLGFDRLERIIRQTRETSVDPTAMSRQVGESQTSKVYNL